VQFSARRSGKSYFGQPRIRNPHHQDRRNPPVFMRLGFVAPPQADGRGTQNPALTVNAGTGRNPDFAIDVSNPSLTVGPKWGGWVEHAETPRLS
jgi:hypothetical protein